MYPTKDDNSHGNKKLPVPATIFKYNTKKSINVHKNRIFEI